MLNSFAINNCVNRQLSTEEVLWYLVFLLLVHNALALVTHSSYSNSYENLLFEWLRVKYLESENVTFSKNKPE